MTWPLSKAKQLTCSDYVVALICALPREKAAARNMLDELHVTPPQPDVDNNVYTCGRIHRHNVVIVCQSDMGTTAAATVATQLVSTFRQLRFGLLVGIAGGVPDYKDIRLGDVVISRPDGQSGGVVVHDRGKVTPAGFESRSFLNGVPELLRNAFNEFESLLMDHGNRIHECIARAIDRNPLFKEFDRPLQVDCLFKSNYKHINTQNGTCQKCLADDANLVSRPSRGVVQHIPFVHFGIVASGNQVIKDGTERAKIAERYPSVLAIEMEAGGLMNILGCATIRGICDYADSHKNDSWQNYAAATAAAATKEVLGIIPEKTTSQSLVAEPSFNSGEFSIEFELPSSAVSRSFVKRDELRVIKEAFLHKQHTAQRQVFVLHGVGGIGKTRLAIEFARQYHREFTGVFWIDGSTKDSVRLGIASLKDRLPTHQQSQWRQDATAKHADDLQEAINDVMSWLSQRQNNRWLMVFDNVDHDWAPGTADPDSYNPMDYFPKSDYSFILVTTQLPYLQDLVGETSLKIPKMDKD